jgi:hypothetical protein
MDQKTISMADIDYVLLYEVDEGIDPFGLGGQEWAHERIIAMDIRTTYKRAAIPDIRAHIIKMKDEVYRIVKANLSDPDSDHHLLKLKRRRDLSDKRTGVGRFVIDTSWQFWGA